MGTPGGLRLSYATLGAFIKYPKASLPHRPTPHVAHKIWFFSGTKVILIYFQRVRLGGLQFYHRNPLAYLVEAADDICYTIIDFEDGIHLDGSMKNMPWNTLSI